jgi:ABC-type glycerol-3-phosphate transport system substrate-binding protein
LRFEGVVVLFIVAALLCGCAPRHETEPTTITVAVPQWYAPEKASALGQAVRDWNTARPATTVSIKVLAGKREALLQKILLAAQRGELADAVLVRDEWLGRLAADGLIDPLPASQATVVRQSVLPSLLPAIADERNVWAVPFDADALVIWLRRDLADQRDPGWSGRPWTTDHFAVLARTLTDRSNPQAVRFGFAFPGARALNTAVTFLTWYLGRGGRLVDEQGRLTLDTLNATAALERLLELVRSGAAPRTTASLEQNDVFRGLAGGAYAMTLGGSWERSMLARQSQLGGQIMSLPIPASGDHPSTTVLGGWSFVLLKRHRVETADFLANTFSPPVQEKKLIQDELLPTHVAILKNRWFETNPDGRTLSAALTTGRVLPLQAGLTAYLDQISTMVAEVFLGANTPNEAVDRAAHNIRDLP